MYRNSLATAMEEVCGDYYISLDRAYSGYTDSYDYYITILDETCEEVYTEDVSAMPENKRVQRFQEIYNALLFGDFDFMEVA